MGSSKVPSIVVGGALIGVGLWLSFPAHGPALITSPAPAEKAPAVAPAPAAELPDDFQKLLEQAKAKRESEPASSNTVEERGLKVGAPLPELKGDWLTPTGHAPDLTHKVLLIDFFTTVCGSCVESIPANNALYAKFAAQGFVFAFVSSEPKALVEDFKTNFSKKIEYPVLTNANELFELFNVKTLPATYLFGRDGTLLWKGGLLEKDGKYDEGFEKALDEALKAK